MKRSAARCERRCGGLGAAPCPMPHTGETSETGVVMTVPGSVQVVVVVAFLIFVVKDSVHER